MLISQSQDGEHIHRIIKCLGFHTVRGSSSKGGLRGLRGLVKAVEAGYDVAITPDGPRGPARQVQSGVIHLARHTGAPIVPITTSANRYKQFRSWDQFLVPYPFSKAVIFLGEPLFVPSDITEQEINAYQIRLQKELDRITEEADRYCQVKIS